MTSLPSFFTSKSKTRKRAGVSPVIATTIILAITVVLGLSLWSFTNSSVSAATQNYADAVTEYGKFTSDRFVIASAEFNYQLEFDDEEDGYVTVWVYNSGKAATVVNTVLISCKDCGLVPIVSFAPIVLEQTSFGSTTVAPKTLQAMEFDAIAAFPSGKTFEVQVISETGAHQVLLQKEN